MDSFFLLMAGWVSGGRFLLLVVWATPLAWGLWHVGSFWWPPFDWAFALNTSE